jgi:hypothetical protein
MLQASTLGAAAALGRNSVVCVATRIGTGAVVRADNYVCADVPAGDIVGRGRYPLP